MQDFACSVDDIIHIRFATGTHCPVTILQKVHGWHPQPVRTALVMRSVPVLPSDALQEQVHGARIREDDVKVQIQRLLQYLRSDYDQFAPIG